MVTIRLFVLEQKSNPAVFTSESSKGVGLQLDHDCWDMKLKILNTVIFSSDSEEESYTVGYSLTYAESFSESSLPVVILQINIVLVWVLVVLYHMLMPDLGQIQIKSVLQEKYIVINLKYFSRNSYLDFNGEEIKVDVTLCNKGDTDIHNVYYFLRSFDQRMMLTNILNIRHKWKLLLKKLKDMLIVEYVPPGLRLTGSAICLSSNDLREV